MGVARVHGSGDDWYGENVWGGANPESDDIPYAIQDGIDIFLGRSFSIRVFDSQHEFAVMMASIPPGIQSHAHTAKVENAGRAGDKARTD